MNNKNLIGPTKNIYRLTLLFPKKEPLRYKIRELADEILAASILCSNENPKKSTIVEKVEKPTIVGKAGQFATEEILKDLEILDSFFEVAIAQNWVSPFELLEVQKEYVKIKEEIESSGKTKETETFEAREMTIDEMAISFPQNPLFKERKTEDSPLEFPEGKDRERINERQKRIIEILREKEKAQVWEIKQIFPEVTKRTLRRDFEHMLKQGLIQRIGERNNTFYQLKASLD